MKDENDARPARAREGSIDYREPDDDLRTVLWFAATSLILFARHRNVEEGDYFRCRCCGGKSLHGRAMATHNIAHAQGCPVALARRLLVNLPTRGGLPIVEGKNIRNLGVSPAVAVKLLELRDELAKARKGDEDLVALAWYVLYSIANPSMTSLTPWAELESLAAQAPESTVALEGRRCTCNHRCPIREEWARGATCVHADWCELAPVASGGEEQKLGDVETDPRHSLTAIPEDRALDAEHTCEWRIQHDNLLAVKEQDNGALLKRVDNAREFFCHWLVRVYEAGHRDASYQEGETLDNVLREINQVLGFAGYEPESKERAELLTRSFAWRLEDERSQ